MHRKRTFALFVVLALLVSCASTDPGRTAFNSLKTLRASVEASLKVFNAGYQAGQFSEFQRSQVGVLYDKYLAADRIAAQALATTTETDPAAIVARVTIIAAEVLKFVQTLKTGGP